MLIKDTFPNTIMILIFFVLTQQISEFEKELIKPS